jgi:hypothetical protein
MRVANGNDLVNENWLARIDAAKLIKEVCESVTDAD